jgi:hypothetical protein
MTVRTVVDNPNQPDHPKFYHGGKPGLQPGDLILSPSVTKSKPTVGRVASADVKRKHRDDRVFITPDAKFALFFAAMHPSGEGVVYQVEPMGDLEVDPHWELINSEGTGYRETKQCESVVATVKVPDGMFAEARLLVAPAKENKWERTQREALERKQRRAAMTTMRRATE